ncbi:urease accessory protein UreE [Salinirubellus sp. GCM10025818]|uniref:urease accessory protein UreE n=1 Tax=Salinirubellus TaxID=2162630 RepID=UPI0030CACE8F
MLVADTYLGRRDEEGIAARLAESGYETIHVSPVERRRSRFRTTTEAGIDLGVTVGRELRDGDVLDAEGTFVVVELDAVQALAVDLGEVDAPFGAGVRFGHALGNRHRELVVRDDSVLVRIEDDPARLERELDPLLPDGATVDRTTVAPTVFGESTGHDHAHGGSGHTRGDGGHAHGEDGHTHGDAARPAPGGEDR